MWAKKKSCTFRYDEGMHARLSGGALNQKCSPLSARGMHSPERTAWSEVKATHNPAADAMKKSMHKAGLARCACARIRPSVPCHPIPRRRGTGTYHCRIRNLAKVQKTKEKENGCFGSPQRSPRASPPQLASPRASPPGSPRPEPLAFGSTASRCLLPDDLQDILPMAAVRPAAAGSGKDKQIADLKAEVTALKKEIAEAKQIADLKAEVTTALKKEIAVLKESNNIMIVLRITTD